MYSIKTVKGDITEITDVQAIVNARLLRLIICHVIM